MWTNAALTQLPFYKKTVLRLNISLFTCMAIDKEQNERTQKMNVFATSLRNYERSRVQTPQVCNFLWYYFFLGKGFVDRKNPDQCDMMIITCLMESLSPCHFAILVVSSM